MDAFINVSKKDPQVQKEIKGMLDKYEKNYHWIVNQK